MKIKFSLNYFAGQDEYLALLLENKKVFPLRMDDEGNGLWTAQLDLGQNYIPYIKYAYAVYRGDREHRREYPFPKRELSLADIPLDYTLDVQDSWRDVPPNSFLYSSAFNDGFKTCGELSLCDKTLLIKTYAPQARKDFILKICGSDDNLGNWKPENAPIMQKTAPNEWSIALDASKMNFPLEFKFVAIHGEQVFWQKGENCRLNAEIKSKEVLAKNDYFPVFDIPLPRESGIVLPVFSLRSKDSFGVGDFGDLKKLADWAVAAGQKVIQILPINDTAITGTWTDSYPYASISIYAIHPMYMDLNALGPLKNKNKQYWFDLERRRLNAAKQVEYEQVNALKRAYIKTAYRERYKEFPQDEGYLKFFEANKEWLRPYAAFCYLRDKYKTADFSKWPSAYRIYDKARIYELTSPKSKAYKEVRLHYFTQYNLHLQLLDAANYARSKGLILKGDIPIGISRNSVEAWTEPHYFNMQSQAGAPPDDFSVNGQNWGFPTYNWEEMAKDGYLWWKKRFKKMAEYFDAYRIDHVLGFFRIWDIPLSSVHGLLGQFSPAMPMSAEEIKNFGLDFKEQYLKPYIDDKTLKKFFPEKAELVKSEYLIPLEGGLYELKEPFNTQRKTEEYFKEKTDAESQALKEGLYSLISNVLFVADKSKPDMYHPRISALKSLAFEALPEDKKQAYTNLYNNYFYHRHNDFWKKEAMAKLPTLVHCTAMLSCAEDLGMIPACVPEVMNDLQILSLEIQRMPKSPLDRFGDPSKYPYLSVCTISTHDMATLRGWWREDKEQTQSFYNRVLRFEGAAPQEADGKICEEVLRMNLAAPSMLCLNSFQDWLSIDEKRRLPDIESERINIPSNPKHYWRYRMHIALEDLISDNELNYKMRALTAQSGRL